jgi:ATP-binding cassette subfamily B protein
MRHKGAVALIVVLLVAKAACELAIPVFTSQIIDVGIAQSGIEDLAELERLKASGADLFPLQMTYLLRTGALMLLMAALSMGLDIATGFVASRTGAQIGRSLRSQLFARVVAFSDGEINKFSAASLITRGTNDIVLIQNVSIMLMRMVLYAPILAIGGIIMILATNVTMGWIVVVAIAVVFGVIGLLFKFTMPRFKIMQKLIDRVNLVAREMLTGLPVVRAFNRDAFEEERFDKASARLMRTQLFTNRAMSFMMPTMMLVMNLTSVAIVWFGAGNVAAGTMQTGDVVAFITYAMVIIMGSLMMGMISVMLPRADVAAERVQEVLACEPSVHDPEGGPSSEDTAVAGEEAVVQTAASAGEGVAEESALVGTRSENTPSGARIEFKNVTFRYTNEGDPALQNVSFVAEPGTTLAVVGSTGSGKTTLVKLIERFYDVTEGAVLVNGVDVRDLPQQTLREKLGYVPQKAFLFSGTIESNISYGDTQATEADIKQTLEVACALDFVEAREGGLQSEMAQGGTNVSGGQRQRLSIARALVRRPQAYLFDDCFSALDYATDAQVRAALPAYSQGSTIIMVAQRISTVRGADTIVVLDEGRVVGQGTHAHLLKTCQEYREIALSQLSEDELKEDLR